MRIKRLVYIPRKAERRVVPKVRRSIVAASRDAAILRGVEPKATRRRKIKQREECLKECNSLDSRIKRCDDIIEKYSKRVEYLLAWELQEPYAPEFDQVRSLRIGINHHINVEMGDRGKIIAEKDRATITLNMPNAEIKMLTQDE